MDPAQWGNLSEAEIIRRLSKTPAGDPPFLEGFRQAAVLVPLLQEDGVWRLLFTRRTETVQKHKGQVSFPGGASESGDTSPEETALREAAEEIGLQSADVTLLGRLASLVTVSHFVVTPILARVPWPYPFLLSAQEVSRVFTLPLAWLANPAHWEIRPRVLPGGAVEDVIHYQEYDGETLWGISARITLELLETLDACEGAR